MTINRGPCFFDHEPLMGLIEDSGIVWWYDGQTVKLGCAYPIRSGNQTRGIGGRFVAAGRSPP